MSLDNIITLIVSLLSLLVGVITFIYITTRKKGRYDSERGAILSDNRDFYEKQIYELNDRLVQSEERWRDVNHLLLTKNNIKSEHQILKKEQTYYTEFLRANGISQNDLIIDNKMVFLLTPFNTKFYNEYLTIMSICSRVGFRCVRGDEEQFKGDIFPEMLRYMAQAKVIIANINGRNSNVMYELGVAQAMDKDVILISKEPKDLPIDVQSQRFLIYSDSDSLEKLLENELKKFI